MRKSLTVVATSDTVRIVHGQELIATHVRSWGKGAQIEDPAHLDALVASKRKAKDARGMNRIFRAVPEAQELLRRLAERGGNLGNAVRRLGELVELYGATTLTKAITEALEKDAPHVAALRQILDRERPIAPSAVTLPDHPKAREVVVRQAPLSAYDSLKKGDSRDE